MAEDTMENSHTMLTHPLKTPADPRPLIALPTMKDLELGAAPHIVDCRAG
jgi:hypothetical protein